MPFTLVTPPVEEPLTTAEAQTHLGVASGVDDAFIDRLIAAARQLVEGQTERQLVTATWDITLDRFPLVIDLGKCPVQSITHIKYLDPDGVVQTLAASEYRLDAASEPARITPEFEKTWPAFRAVTNSVTVRFVAGYGNAAAVPESAKQAILLLVGHWYDNRNAVGQVGPEIELSFKALLWDLKWTL